jgi:hypothetical protein
VWVEDYSEFLICGGKNALDTEEESIVGSKYTRQWWDSTWGKEMIEKRSLQFVDAMTPNYFLLTN